MAEHVLRGPMGILPREEGGRHIVVSEGNGDVYRIPMGPALHKEVYESLGLSDEELAERAERQRAAAEIVRPGQGADIPDLSAAGNNGQGPASN